MRDLAMLISRVAVGGFIASHGAQKLFGTFGGPGIEAAASGFGAMGLKPAKPLAIVGSANELVGGALVAAGALNPLGAIMTGSAMITASTVHKPAGFYAMKGGFELPLTNALAVMAMAAFPGKYKLGPALPAKAAIAVAAGAAVVAGYSINRIIATQNANSATVAVEDDESVINVAGENVNA